MQSVSFLFQFLVDILFIENGAGCKNLRYKVKRWLSVD